jgi:translation initiation factor IF-3
MKEVKFTPNISDHDYGHKLKRAKKFLDKGHNVKLTITFKGRQIVFKEHGTELLGKIRKDLKDVAVVQSSNMKGRQMVAVAQPKGK